MKTTWLQSKQQSGQALAARFSVSCFPPKSMCILTITQTIGRFDDGETRLASMSQFPPVAHVCWLRVTWGKSLSPVARILRKASAKRTLGDLLLAVKHSCVGNQQEDHGILQKSAIIAAIQCWDNDRGRRENEDRLMCSPENGVSLPLSGPGQGVRYVYVSF